MLTNTLWLPNLKLKGTLQGEHISEKYKCIDACSGTARFSFSSLCIPPQSEWCVRLVLPREAGRLRTAHQLAAKLPVGIDTHALCIGEASQRARVSLRCSTSVQFFDFPQVARTRNVQYPQTHSANGAAAPTPRALRKHGHARYASFSVSDVLLRALCVVL